MAALPRVAGQPERNPARTATEAQSAHDARQRARTTSFQLRHPTRQQPSITKRKERMWHHMIGSPFRTRAARAPSWCWVPARPGPSLASARAVAGARMLSTTTATAILRPASVVASETRSGVEGQRRRSPLATRPAPAALSARGPNTCHAAPGAGARARDLVSIRCGRRGGRGARVTCPLGRRPAGACVRGWLGAGAGAGAAEAAATAQACCAGLVDVGGSPALISCSVRKEVAPVA